MCVCVCVQKETREESMYTRYLMVTLIQYIVTDGM